MDEIKKMQQRLDELGLALEEFKRTHTAALDEVKKRGDVRGDTAEKLGKLDEVIEKITAEHSDYRARIEAVEKVAARPSRVRVAKPHEVPEVVEHVRAFGEFLRTARNDRSPAHTQAIVAMEEKRVLAEKALEEMGHRAVTIGTDSAGGYAVPEVINSMILEYVTEISPMRRKARVVQASTSDYKELVDLGGEASGWVGEGDSRTETATAALGEVAPTFGICYAYPKNQRRGADGPVV